MTRLKIRKEMLVIGIILFIAFLLRVKQSVPFNSVDELTIGRWIIDLHSEPFPVHIYPMFFLYFHFLLSLLYKTVLVFTGFINNGSEFLTNSFGLNFLMEAGRIWAAVFGTAIVYTVYKLGTKFYNRNVGIFAAIILAVNKLMVLHSHIFKSDILLALILTIYLFLCLQILQNPSLKTVALTSFIFGISVATKYNALPLIITLIASLFFIRSRFNKNNWFKYFGIIPIASLGGFFLSSPNWIIHPISNIKKFVPWYVGGSQNSQWGYKGQYYIIKGFFRDFTANFWLILIILFFIGIIFALIRKNKNDIVILIFILSYISIISFSGFYGDRMGLPVYSSIALIIAKTIFFDLKKFFYEHSYGEKISSGTTGRRIAVFFVWGIIIMYGVFNIGFNLKSYNLLHTRSKDSRVTQYRTKHNILGIDHLIASQHTTKRMENDLRLNRNYIPNKKRRRNKDALLFLQVNTDLYDNVRLRESLLRKNSVNLKNFLTFYEISKPRFQLWNNDIQFLYKAAPEIRDSSFLNNDPKLPRVYSYATGTINFPLQKYEKNPAFGKINNGTFTQWLYSKHKLNKIKFYFFSPYGHLNITLKINNKKYYFKEDGPDLLKIVEIDKIEPKKLHHDNVYFINVESPVVHKTYMVIAPQYEKNDNGSDTDITIRNRISGDIPVLFSKTPFPEWVIEFYRKTGVDLSLLTFINTNSIYENGDKFADKFSSDFFPLDPGIYKLRLNSEKLIQSGTDFNLKIVLINEEQKTIQDIKMTSQELSEIDLEIKDHVSFIQIIVSNLKSSNLILKNISIKPDFKKIVKEKF